MKMLVISHSQVKNLLPMDECIDIMAETLTALARGQAFQPLRMTVRPPEAAGIMVVMPSYMAGAHPAYGLKAVCVFPGNPAKGKDAHQGTVMIFSAETGEPKAVMNASAITAIRTAAVSGVATRLLARPDAADLAIIGAGVQARPHLEAITCVRPIQRVRVADCDFNRARAFVDEMRTSVSATIEIAKNIELAVREADVIVTVTTSREPVLKREWIAPGAHINAVGASMPTTREIDTETIKAASLFVDRRESTLNESGDYLLAMREGAIGPDHIKAEIGEVLTGAKPGRTSDGEITVFKSLGLAVEDLASAEYIFRKAQQAGIGAWVEF